MILDLLRTYQLNIMLILCGMCGMMAFMAVFDRSKNARRKRLLISIELTSMFLLLSDRFAYIFRGDVSRLGYYMVRISNFLVFFLTLFIIHVFSLYLIDLYENEGGYEKAPKRLIVSEVIFTIGEILIVISQFTGIYYTFDDQNRYQRADGYIICFAMPFIISIIQMTTIVQLKKKLNKRVFWSLFFFTSLPVFASLVQVFTYGVSLNNMTIAILSITLFMSSLIDLNESVERANKIEMDYLKIEQKNIHALFEQTAEALASAIDAKDKYTRGHSARVAEYSREIAIRAGMNEREVEEVFFAALLHDVGKIGIADSIINKEGKLTDEEYAEIKKHSDIGAHILGNITKSPYLAVGAHYHHERYDGRGYPEGLKGEDIPQIARIIAVADAYDAMTSKRSYRETIPQQKVREEIVKGFGTQFDPKYADIMMHMIDQDLEYEMQESAKTTDEGERNEFIFESLDTEFSRGVLIEDSPVTITMHSKPAAGFAGTDNIPTLVFYDALDSRTHVSDEKAKDFFYTEYLRVRLDGKVEEGEIRKLLHETTEDKVVSNTGHSSMKAGTDYEISCVRVKDHMLITLKNSNMTHKYTVAMPDATRFCYAAVTGKNCHVTRLNAHVSDETVQADYIPRIAEEINYISGPEGDLPNLQIDGWRKSYSAGIPIADGLKISFHSKSLPTARLVWHCPFISIFSASDGKPFGEDYHEYALLRLDGELWEPDANDDVRMIVDHSEEFVDWDKWKELNREGIDCEVSFKIRGERIIITTENGGIRITIVVNLHGEEKALFASITGDQCAITSIHI